MRSNKNTFFKVLNVIDVIGIVFILLIAFGFQFYLKELPCPLCLLQRVGLIAIAFGFLLNIRYSIRPSHYAISLLSAVLTSFVSLRQILLHIAPGDTGYGSMVLGLHMYTWLFIVCMLAIIYISIVMSSDIQYKINKDSEKHTVYKSKFLNTLSHIAFALFLAIIVANIASLIAECGFTSCPDNPVSYKV